MGSGHPFEKNHQVNSNRSIRSRGERRSRRVLRVIERAFDALVPRIEDWKRSSDRPLTLFVVRPADRKIEYFMPDPLVTGRLSAVVVGRDVRCDLRIRGDAGVSGQHALLVYRTYGYDGSCRVFDLGSNTGVLGVGAERIRGEKILPPFALLMGNAVVFGLSHSSWIERASEFRSVRWNRRLETRSFATSPWDDEDPPLGKLAARGRGGTAGVELSAESLDRGVIIGADPRCAVSRALAGDESAVCDKHALIFRHESRVQAVDLRSESGTSYADCPVAVPLPLPSAEPSRLVLGPNAYATWTPYAGTGEGR